MVVSILFCAAPDARRALNYHDSGTFKYDVTLIYVAVLAPPAILFVCTHETHSCMGLESSSKGLRSVRM